MIHIEFISEVYTLASALLVLWWLFYFSDYKCVTSSHGSVVKVLEFLPANLGLHYADTRDGERTQTWQDEPNQNPGFAKNQTEPHPMKNN